MKGNYITVLIAHVLLGILVFFIPFLSKIYSTLILLVGLYFIIKNKNSNNEVLYVAAYLVGGEVFLRMTEGNSFHEMTKYSVTIFMFLGVFYSNFRKGASLYFIYLLLLIPGVFIAIQTLNFETNIRKAILFNLSGPICLGFCAIYCYRRNISLEEINKILLYVGFPIISTLVYIFLYNPSIKDVVTHTQSNFETSGGFGPNQVATILGLGAFIFFSRIVLGSKNKIIVFFDILACLLLTYRGIVTFSRGGMMTAGIMVIAFLIVLFLVSKYKIRMKLFLYVILGISALSIIWSISSSQTGGLIDKRYANEGVNGNKKESKLTGREDLIDTELMMFFNNPIFGVGVGKNREYREELTGIESASHNEITRMVAEHGTFGIVAFLILSFVPLLLYLNNKMNIYVLSFFIFWLLTLNHAAMRIAAPAFIYSLMLLKVYSIEKTTLHR